MPTESPDVAIVFCTGERTVDRQTPLNIFDRVLPLGDHLPHILDYLRWSITWLVE